MKKVKITILKTTLDAELAKEYGVKDLTACPMMEKGQVFMLITQSPMDSAMRPGKLSISMYLHWPMAAERSCFITVTGSISPMWRSAAATMA